MVKNYENINVDNLLEEYFIQFHYRDIIDVLYGKFNQTSLDIYMDFMNLIDLLPQVAHLFFKCPEKSLAQFELIFKKSKEKIKENFKNKPSHLCAKTLLRIINLPICEEIMPTSFPMVQQLHRFLSIKGIVIRTGLVQMIEKEMTYVCEKCFKTFNVSLTIERNFNASKPDKCIDIECRSVKFRPLRGDDKSGKIKDVPQVATDDYQEIRIQEKACTYKTFYPDRCNQLGRRDKVTRRSLTVILIGDGLVDKVKVGDDILVNGVLTMRRLYVPSPKNVTLSNDTLRLELVFEANYIETNGNTPPRPSLLDWHSHSNDGQSHENCLDIESQSHEGSDVISYSPTFTQFEKNIEYSPESKGLDHFERFWRDNALTPFHARNLILASLCPKIYGMYVVKLAVALILAGGVSIPNENNSSSIRSESHLLLVGDPGTGKSQILKYLTKLLPRSVYATGVGSTSAGLTVSAVKEGNDWGLEAGALVMADGGVCCVDELNCIRESDRAALHEAMEQQTISVAKAGIVCKLSCKTSIIATANPRGKYDALQPITVNTGMSGPLISRFDLIFILLDKHDSDWDKMISSHILNSSNAPNKKEIKPQAFENLNGGLWSMDEIRSYFNIIRTKKPQMTKESNRIISRYYCKHRQQNNKAASRSTIRLLESLVRLAQAHAKLMFHEYVEVQDAVSAVCLMECSLQSMTFQDTNDSNTLISNIFESTTTFPDDPDKEYRMQEKITFDAFVN